jgi:hypothetical protein
MRNRELTEHNIWGEVVFRAFYHASTSGVSGYEHSPLSQTFYTPTKGHRKGKGNLGQIKKMKNGNLKI